MSETRIELAEGKYTLISDNGKLSALRYGEPWRDLCGDNLIYWAMVEIEELQSQVFDLRAALSATLSQCIAWQGEPHEDSCAIHKTIVQMAKNALKSSGD